MSTNQLIATLISATLLFSCSLSLFLLLIDSHYFPLACNYLTIGITRISLISWINCRMLILIRLTAELMASVAWPRLFDVWPHVALTTAVQVLISGCYRPTFECPFLSVPLLSINSAAAAAAINQNSSSNWPTTPTEALRTFQRPLQPLLFI